MRPLPPIAFVRDQTILTSRALPTRPDGNALWHITTPQGAYVIRQRLRDDTDLQTEIAMTRMAGRIGIAPALVAHEGDAVVMRYIHGTHKHTLTRADMHRLSAAIASLHRQPPPSPQCPRIDLSERIRPDRPEVREAFATLRRFRAPLVPSHNDLTPRNILWESDRVWLVDFEYSGLNDPCFDLAAVSVEFDLTDHDRELWRTICQTHTPCPEPKFAALQTLYRALWRQWEADIAHRSSAQQT